MKKRLLCAALVLCCAAACCACSQKIDSADRNFTVTVPGGWSESQLNDDAAELAVRNLKKQQYITVYCTAKDSGSGMTVSSFASDSAADLLSRTDNCELAEPEETEAAGLPAVKFSATGSVDGTELKYYVYCMESECDYIRILCWTTAAKSDGAEKDFGSIISTFTIN